MIEYCLYKKDDGSVITEYEISEREAFDLASNYFDSGYNCNVSNADEAIFYNDTNIIIKFTGKDIGRKM